MLVYPAAAVGTPNSFTMTEASTSSSGTSDVKVRVVAPDDSPDVNIYKVDVYDTATQTTRLTHTLNLNLRTGFDATSTAALDTPDTTKPYLTPISFGVSATEWSIDLVIPASWFGNSLGATEQFVVTVTNLWNDTPQSIIID